MTDHSPVSVRRAGTGWTARCACGEYWTRRHVEQAEESHTRHAAEMARVAARRPSKAENRTAVEAMHEPLFGDQPEEGAS